MTKAFEGSIEYRFDSEKKKSSTTKEQKLEKQNETRKVNRLVLNAILV